MSLIQVNNITAYTGNTVAVLSNINLQSVPDGISVNNLGIDADGNVIIGTGGSSIDVRVTGGTYTNGTAEFTNNTGGTFTVSGFTVGGTEITYADLLELHNASGLTIGMNYLITDYQTCYDQPDFNFYGNGIYGDNYKQGPVEPLLVFANSTFGLAPDAHSPMYPEDKITYDITWTATEATNSVSMGRITERIDEKGNRTDYDHRNILFKRYNSYSLDNKLDGSITYVGNNTVVGFNTWFLDELSVNDIIFIPTPDSNSRGFYKVTNIIDNNNLEIEGKAIYNYNSNGEYGVGIWYCVQETESIPGTMYYFNDVSSNNYNIDDGGDDMYDGGNYMSTNLGDNIPYTHTQMTINSYNEASLTDFTMDGTVQVGDGYFGAESSYFTNLYPDLFVMVADNISVDYFQIDGGLGADGSGSVNTYEYSTTVNGVDYKAFAKRVGDGGFDPSVNHIIIAKTSSTGLTHTISDDTNNDLDTVSGFTSNNVTQIHYLLTALSQGVRLTNQQVDDMVEAYLISIGIDSDVNTILSNLNSNYQAITSVLPQKSLIIDSLDYKESNIVGQTGYTEYSTFQYANSINTYVGDYAKYYNLYEYPFMLANNTFGSYFYRTYVMDNHIGDNSGNNSFGGDFYQNNIQSECYNNLFHEGFYKNNIGVGFNNNVSFRNDFETNTIGDNFSYNTLTNYFWRNSINSYFKFNVITDYFTNNNIENEFNRNIITSEFKRNIIGGEFNDNTIYCNFYQNSIGENFYYNIIYSRFFQNVIGYYFNYNKISDRDNLFEGDYKDNIIANYFSNNSISYNFYSNNIKSNFQYNTINDYFRLNNVEVGFGEANLTSATHVYNYYTCNVIATLGGSFKLTYIDGTTLTIVEPNA